MIRIERFFMVVFFIGCFVFGFLYKCADDRAERNEGYRELNKVEHQAAVQFKDEANRWHSRAEQAYISSKTIEDNPAFQKMLSEFQDIKKNLKNTTSIQTLSTESSYKYNLHLKDTTIKICDTIRVIRSARYHDQWIDINALVDGNDLRPEIIIRDSLTCVGYWKRKWILSRKKYYSEIISQNPHTRITYNRSLIITKKRK